MAGAKGTPHGWYLSTAVSVPVYNKVNAELLKLILKGTLKEIMDRTISDDRNTCGTTKLSISPPLIMVPLSILLVPVLLTIFGLSIRKVVMDKLEQKNAPVEDALLPAQD